MDSQDFAVLKQVQAWLHEKHAVLLVTVVKTWGASPRPVGALLALRADGLAVGSVSGGCIEDDLIDQLQTEGMPTKPSLVLYGETAEEARRLGLPCGGSMQLVLEPIREEQALDTIISDLSNGLLVQRQLNLKTSEVHIHEAEQKQTTHYAAPILCSIYGPRYRLLLIGAGQISQLLAEIAISLDFVVTVCDPRAQYAALWQVPDTHLTREMPDDVVLSMAPDSRMAVITLTHDPKLDDLALMEALKTPAFYVAALGSKQNNKARKLRLREFDVSKAQLAKLHGPAGLYIGSKTPSEIAVSIAAQLVAVKNMQHNEPLEGMHKNAGQRGL